MRAYILVTSTGAHDARYRGQNFAHLIRLTVHCELLHRHPSTVVQDCHQNITHRARLKRRNTRPNIHQRPFDMVLTTPNDSLPTTLTKMAAAAETASYALGASVLVLSLTLRVLALQESPGTRCCYERQEKIVYDFVVF